MMSSDPLAVSPDGKLAAVTAFPAAAQRNYQQQQQIQLWHIRD